MCRSHLTVAALAVILSTTTSQHTHAQIVSDATGTIDLKLNPFFDTGPIWSEEDNTWVWGPLESQHEVVPVGLSDVSASFDGGGYYSAGGLTEFDYDYESTRPGEAWFNFHAYALTADAGDGSNGYSKLDMQITFNHPVSYRFEAEAIDFPMSYSVMFNETEAKAYGGGYGIREGTFPILWIQEDGVNVYAYDFGPHIDQGILPAGTYDLSVYAYTGLHRYGIGLGSEGTASLHIQLLGDANLNGRVGIEDLNRVLNHWGKTPPKGGAQFGDLNADGYIGIADLNRVLTAWNADVRPPQTIAASVPEPTAACLLLTLGLALARSGRRRRP